MNYKNKIISISCLLFLTSCATEKVAEKGKIFSGGKIHYSIKEVNEDELNKKTLLNKENQYIKNKVDVSKVVVNKNRENISLEQNNLKEFLTVEPKIHIPDYDILHPENKLILSEFENTVFKNSILYKAIKDAKNLNNEEISYFSKNKSFLMPTNQITFLVFYPCADVSDKFKEGYVNLKRTVEISAGKISGEKNINGYISSIDNREIRMVLDELADVLKKDTGWIYSENNCIDIEGRELKMKK